MDDQALIRYSRHLLLNEWGEGAQEKLAAAKVLVVGMGGLGCPAAHTLASAGLGQLTIADGDVVDASNLQRQHLHTSTRIGMAKVLSAAIALHEINPLCVVTAIHQRLEGAALVDTVAAHDMVLDCSDNAATRYAINRACVAQKKPLISGSAIRFDGQLIVFDSRTETSPCYHCLFPEDAHVSEADRCAVMGVFAPLTQQIGNLQGAFAIQLITGVGTVVRGRLQLFDALNAVIQSISVAKNATCKVCGINA